MPPAARAVIRACRSNTDEGSGTGTAASRDKATPYPDASRAPEATGRASAPRARFAGHAVKTRTSTRIPVPFQKMDKT